MALKTLKYELRKKEDNDFYDFDDLNDNWDKVENALTEFDDSGTAEGVTSFPEMLTKLVTGNKLAVTLKNLKAGLQFVLHAGSIVNNCVTDNANLPVSAAMAKSLQDQINQANSNLGPIRYLLADTFDDAWNQADSKYMYFIDVSSSTDAPSSANHWFGQMWKNDSGLYGWQIVWSFSGSIYKRQRYGSNAWSSWTSI